MSSKLQSSKVYRISDLESSRQVLANSDQSFKSILPTRLDTCQDAGYPAYTNSTIAPKSIEDYGFMLTGESGKARDSCGSYRWKGCLNNSKHTEKKTFVKGYRSSCNMRSCPVCLDGYCNREAKVAQRRFIEFTPSSYRAPIHVTISPPRSEYHTDVKTLRKMSYKLLAKIGVKSGLIVFHPARRATSGRDWSPHFHAICFGWVLGDRVADLYKSRGWIARNHGVRKNVFGVVRYLASHLGVKKGFNSISWFGALSFNKPRIRKAPKDDVEVCPYCSAELVNLEYYGIADPPDPDFEGLVDPEGWDLKIGKWDSGTTGLDNDAIRAIKLEKHLGLANVSDQWYSYFRA